LLNTSGTHPHEPPAREVGAGAASGSRSARRQAVGAVKVAVSILLLGILFSRVDVNGLWASASRASASWLLQALLVGHYLAVGYALNVPITVWDLAVIVPISFVVQMMPVSVNGFGVREAAFSLYFTRLGLPMQAALLLSLMATALMMVFSLTGAALYMSRGR
jgi:hypothetical protein